ncbi:hypothetical protein QJS10_CPB11g00746 [Acorus calamus]|uniref:Uncharacterized protein n=1 Tax=Acorus calamus TaxID=4465 RepID=A0AAV9DS63_ACOCL|nr:hypothetical protein QJS10_CPB11g00746 [Acorus calamus]
MTPPPLYPPSSPTPSQSRLLSLSSPPTKNSSARSTPLPSPTSATPPPPLPSRPSQPGNSWPTSTAAVPRMISSTPSRTFGVTDCVFFFVLFDYFLFNFFSLLVCDAESYIPIERLIRGFFGALNACSRGWYINR